MNRITAYVISLVGALLLGYGLAASESLAVTGAILLSAGTAFNIYLTKKRNRDIIAIAQAFYDTTVRGLDSILDLGVTGMVGYDSAVDYGNVVLEQMLRILGIKHKVQRISTEKIVEKLVEGRLGDITVGVAKPLDIVILPGGVEEPLAVTVRRQVVDEFCTALSVVNMKLVLLGGGSAAKNDGADADRRSLIDVPRGGE